nr:MULTISPECIES: acyl-CoA dehydrogenase family protein [Aeromicrobium]
MRLGRRRKGDDQMDFEFNEEQATLREISRSALLTHSSPAHVRSLAESGHDVDDKLWRLGTDLGWTGLAIGEDFGGSGQSLVELCIVAEELGRALAAGPFITSSLVGLAVERFGSDTIKDELLPRLADGSFRATWALAEPRGAWTPASVTTNAIATDGDYILHGRKTAVQDAGSSNGILVSAVLGGAPALFMVDPASTGVTLRKQKTLDESRSFYEIDFDNVRVGGGRRLEVDASAVQWLCDAAAVLTSADSLGAGQRLMEMTVDYVKVREQFDRAIGSFQAVKHKISDMAIGVKGTFAATYYAAMSLDLGSPDASRDATVAKSFSSDAMSRLAGQALQSHGGIGFTWEHDLHLYLRRVKTDETLYGDTPAHQERLAALLIDDRPAT